MSTVRVLIVEDERIIAMTLRQMLVDRGYTIVGTAASAESAVRQAKKEVPDLVLMDIHLEGKVDGIDAARQIEEEVGSPIVFLTAYAEAETVRRAAQSRAYGYLVKPVQAAELHATLQVTITRHQYDRELALSHRRLRLALTASKLAVWDWSQRSGKVDTIGDIGGILGNGELDGRSLTDVFSGVDPLDRAQFDQFLERAASSEIPAQQTFRYRTQATDVRWIEAYATVYDDPNPNGQRTIGTIRNVTLQHDDELRLRQAAVVFENAADAIVITDPLLRISAVNRAFERITGFAGAEVVNGPIQIVLPRRFKAESYWQGETVCRRQDGDTLVIRLSITPVRQGDDTCAIVFAFSDITPLRRAQADLEFLAHHDALTSLPNRFAFEDYVDRLTGMANARQEFHIFRIDLDHFKIVNDSRGHAVGDQVLRAIAGRIRTLASDGGFAARLGGDEFGVVLITNRADESEVARFGQSLLAAIAAPIPVNAESLITTASIGVSHFPADGSNREQLTLAADTAMYAAKHEGPNCLLRYHQGIAIQHAERYEIAQGIHRAFDSAQLQLVYQPIISLIDGRITGAEALVRWRHPDKGILSPDRFISIVEDVGLIDRLGEAVLRMACVDWSRWLEAGTSAPRLSLNVSPRQINRGNFPELLRKVLQELSIHPSLLEIEITEGSFQTVVESRKFIGELKEMGVAISIDDFGTGYSSLAVLRDLPVNRIKLDRTFLPLGVPGTGEVALLNGIVTIACAMGLQLTAEGVENQAQLELVRQIGCHEAQGFWFSEPVPFHQLVDLVRNRTFEFQDDDLDSYR